MVRFVLVMITVLIHLTLLPINGKPLVEEVKGTDILVLCPSGWQSCGGSCYRFFDEKLTYIEAQLACKTAHYLSDLPSVFLKTEIEYISENIISSSWIGLSFNETCEERSMRSQQKYQSHSYGDEVCNECLYLTHQGRDNATHVEDVKTADCQQKMAYICKIQLDDEASCSAGWSVYNDSCLLLIEQEMSWSQAKTVCEKTQGSIAVLQSGLQYNYARTILNETNTDVWVELSSNQSSIRSQETTSDDEKDEWTAWLQGEYDGGVEDTCAFLNKGQISLTASCSLNKSVLCQRPKLVQVPQHLPDACDQSDFGYGGSCYVEVSSAASWFSANTTCSSSGGHLADINTLYENLYITSQLSNLYPQMRKEMWLGITYNNSVITSLTGEPLHDAYVVWDAHSKGGDFGCVSASMGADRPAVWHVRECHEKHPYLCQYHKPIGVCPQGWVYYRNHCYYDSHADNLSLGWLDAFSSCSSKGGHLLSLQDQQEEQFVLYQLRSNVLLEFFWIGYNKLKQPEWKWSDGSSQGFINWGINQPDNPEREDCTSYWKSTGWHDANCAIPLEFICKMKEGTETPNKNEVQLPAREYCDDSKVWERFGVSCYYVSSDRKTWTRARRACLEMSADLVTVGERNQSDFLIGMVNRESRSNLWIGLRRNLSGGFDWVDGEKRSYDDWATGEPNNALRQEECAAINTRTGYWNDNACSLQKGYICEKRQRYFLVGRGTTYSSTNRSQPLTTEPPTSKAPLSTSSRLHCPDDKWLYFDGVCYQFRDSPSTWLDAIINCSATHGANLVSIHSRLQQAFLISQMKNRPSQKYWIGLHDKLSPSSFIWSDQSEVNFEFWKDGEPRGFSGHQCVVMTRTGRWRQLSCRGGVWLPLPSFICQTAMDRRMSTVNEREQCTSVKGYLKYNDVCYKLGENKLTWEMARQQCQEDDARSFLASTLDIYEHNYQMVVGSGQTEALVWIGLKITEDGDASIWADNWPVGFTLWDGSVATGHEQCVSLNVTSGTWLTIDCQHRLPYLCKYAEELAPTLPPYAGNSTCPSTSWRDFNSRFCYLIGKEETTQKDAILRCRAEGGFLTSIHQESEDLLLTRAMPTDKSVWIGLQRDHKGNFKWNDKSTLDFQLWREGEPSNRREECVEKLPISGRWNDASCNLIRGYICKYDKEDGREALP